MINRQENTILPAQTRPAASENGRQYLLFLLLILAVGLIVRLVGLGRESFWLDEGFSFRAAGQSSAMDVVRFIARLDVHPPLHYLLLHWWMGWFGHSEFSARLLSALLSFLSLLLFYPLSRMLFGRRTALVACLILSLSPFHVYYAQEARSYAQLTFLALVSYYGFLRWLRRPSLGNAALTAVGGILMCYTHIYGVFFLMAQAAWWLIHWVRREACSRRALGRWVALQGVIVLGFAPWAFVLMRQVRFVENGIWIQNPTLFRVALTFYYFAGSAFALLLFFALALWGAVRWRGGKGPEAAGMQAGGLEWPHPEQSLFLCFWLFVPNLIPYVISKVSQPIYLYRSLIPASPALYLLVAAGLCGIRRPRLRQLALGLVLVASLVKLWDYHTHEHREPWGRIARTIETQAQPGDLLLFHEPFSLSTVYNIYSHRTDLEKVAFPQPGTKDAAAQLKALLAGHRRVWVILAYEGRENALILRAAGQGRRRVYDQRFHTRIEVLRFEP